MSSTNRKYIVESGDRRSKPATKQQIQERFDAGGIPADARVRPFGTNSLIPISDFLNADLPGKVVGANPESPKPAVVRVKKRRCPFCADPIHEDARKCKHCGEILDPTLRQIAVIPREYPPAGTPTQSARPMLRTVWAVVTIFAVGALLAVSFLLFYTETQGTYDSETNTVVFNGRRISAVSYLFLVCGLRATIWCGTPWFLASVVIAALYAASRPEK